MDLFEVLKYVVGSLPGLIAIAWKHKKDKKSESIKDYKDFLKDLETAHDKYLKAKEELIILRAKNKRLTELNTLQNATIKEFESRNKKNEETTTEDNQSEDKGD